jgi:hypothetical protein
MNVPPNADAKRNGMSGRDPGADSADPVLIGVSPRDRLSESPKFVEEIEEEDDFVTR